MNFIISFIVSRETIILIKIKKSQQSNKNIIFY